ncbi:unnamed protein product [Closterium sp. NIES-64]|nr:unnamed protein product [Closterium sp. NIES-64]
MPKVTSCNASLCASGTQQFPNDPLKAVPLPEEEVERQQSGGVGRSARRGGNAGAGATDEQRVRSTDAGGQPDAHGGHHRRIDAVCARAREVEDGLLASIRNGSGAATSACGDWPEACWPVPHMPFATLSDFPRRRYWVFAMSEEQLSNARRTSSRRRASLRCPTASSCFPRPLFIEATRLAPMPNCALVLPKAVGATCRWALLPLCAYWDLTKLAATSEWVSPQLFLLLARAALPNPSVGFMWVQSPYLERTAFHYASEFRGSYYRSPWEANTHCLPARGG